MRNGLDCMVIGIAYLCGNRERHIKNVTLIVGLMLTGLASAQTASSIPFAPSQLTPRDIAPFSSSNTANPVPEANPAATDLVSGSDLAFDVGGVVIDGAFAEMKMENDAFISSIANQHVTVEQVFAASRDLERAYARRGFILSRVVVPHQRIEGAGTVRVQVIDGFIENADLTNLPPSIVPLVSKRLQKIIGLRHVTETQIERALMLSGDLAGLHLRSAIAQGQHEGGVLLVLDGQLDRVTSRVGIDNRLPDTLGQWQWNAAFALNELFEKGDQLYLNLGSGLSDVGRIADNQAVFRMIGGGLVVPIGNDGFSLAAEFLESRTHVASAGIPVSVGDFSRVELRARQSMIASRAQSLGISATIDFITQSLSLPDFAIQFSRDEYSALRLGESWQRWVGDASFGLDITWSKGLGGRDGDLTLPNSRQGTSPNFTRVEYTGRGSFPLGGGFGGEITVRGQSGLGKPLYLSEQFALDSESGVSAFPSGTFSVDTGVTLRGELGLPPVRMIDGIQAGIYVYAASGEGWLAHPTAVEQATIRANSRGIGARVGLSALPFFARANASINFEYGQQSSSATSRPSGTRTSVTATVRF